MTDLIEWMAAANRLCPLTIDSLDWSDPVLTLIGSNWSISTTSAWRVVRDYAFVVGVYDELPERKLGFRVASFEENKQNIRRIHDLIRTHRPQAKVIFTVSPIPLKATFRPVSSITANAVSKALLRGAVDEVYREVQGQGAMFYWPSYEIVQHVFADPWMADRRHVKKRRDPAGSGGIRGHDTYPHPIVPFSFALC